MMAGFAFGAGAAWVTAAAVLALALAVAVFGVWQLRRANRPPLSALQALRLEAVQLREAARALRDAQARANAVFDAIPDGIIAITQNGVIDSLNPAAAAIFKCSAAKTLGRHVNDLIPDFASLGFDSGDVMLPGDTRRHAVDAHRLDGEAFPLEITCCALPRDAEHLKVFVLRDLSTQQNIEQMKHSFVAVVSHELRTPLTSIRGALALLADGSTGELPADAQAMVVMAARNCERLVDLVSDILDLDKLRTGQLDIELEVLDLVRALRDILRTTLGFARLYKVRLLMPGHSGPLWVRVDPRRMAQVMGNLLSNAIKFSPEGGEVSVQLRLDASECTIFVVDQGPGIPVAFRPRVFEKFAQADATNTRARGGSGLGLSITRALVERMNGRIDYFCPSGGGSVFFVVLPLAGAPLRTPDFASTGLDDLIV